MIEQIDDHDVDDDNDDKYESDDSVNECDWKVWSWWKIHCVALGECWMQKDKVKLEQNFISNF